MPRPPASGSHPARAASAPVRVRREEPPLHAAAAGPQVRDMPRKLSEQVVVVTGASSGVGRAIARAFGARGAKVGLIARTREALEHCADEIRRAGGDALVLPLDVADAAAVERAADEVAARWGRIDTWVNDAMVSVFSPVRR